MINLDELSTEDQILVNRLLARKAEQTFRQAVRTGWDGVVATAAIHSPAWAIVNDLDKCVYSFLAIRARLADAYRHLLTALELRMLGSLVRVWQVELAADPEDQKDPAFALVGQVATFLSRRAAKRATWLEGGGAAPVQHDPDFALLLPPAVADAAASTWLADAARHESAVGREGPPP